MKIKTTKNKEEILEEIEKMQSELEYVLPVKSISTGEDNYYAKFGLMAISEIISRLEGK